ncbi:GyrI-like domain-containing protein [Mucilaginibacter sp. HMF5004]|uniref:GyrI-like domain-containing protein n=1 Tax=Mucilaginibacter rivuli TaxID=2857527 RepID=UPI001C5D0D85|nr:GyrI-like domain-containing protein [Mucilaginibacter rivuli]MBW4888867.1 GyrI-like domain-containing protein [Mucilaginibacter rivuli]
MDIIQTEAFSIAGIAIRTTNENGQAAIDIPKLWDRFLSENIMALITNRTDDTIYSVYTDYEQDHTKPYTTLLGCKVKNIDEIPEELTGKTFAPGKYVKFTAKGKLADGIVYQEWVKIWGSDIPRAFTADFEVYGTKAQNPDDAEVDIFIAVQ